MARDKKKPGRGGRRKGGRPHTQAARATSPAGTVVSGAAVEVEPGAAHAHDGGHASVGFYWMIGGVLAVITALEVAVFYIPAMAPVLTPVLLTLSAAKFVLVVMFFMHLRFDSSILTGLFGAGLLLATLLVLGLVILYHYLPALEG
jgi:cytochrome c oxidase subunit 4